MSGLLESGLTHTAMWFLGGLLNSVAYVSWKLMALAAYEAQQPWVQSLRAVMLALTWSLLGLRVAYEALTRYILWAEGTADPDGTVFAKNLLRTVIWAAAGGGLATSVFVFGLKLGVAVVAAPLDQGVTIYHHLAADVATLPGTLLSVAFALTVLVLVGVVLLLVNIVQMAARGAELVVYAVAAPLAALGHLSGPEGGAWAGWWRGLVALSLAQGVQLLAFKGAVASTQAITSLTNAVALPVSTWFGRVGLPVGGAVVGAAASIPAAVGGQLLAAVWLLGWLVVAVRGAHLVREWAYHSGAGGAIVGFSGNLASLAGRNAVSRWAERHGIRIFAGAEH